MNEKDNGGTSLTEGVAVSVSVPTPQLPHDAHTPTPWHTRTANGKLPVVREIRQPHGEASHYRAVIGSGNTLSGPIVATLDFGYGAVVDSANTEFIVRACNSHDELLTALKACVRSGHPNAVDHPAMYAAWEQAAAAIAKAEGR